MRAPAVAGHSTLAVTMPASAATSQSVATAMSSAYQNQPSRFRASGSNGVLATIPWRAGETPVTIVVWLGKMTVGRTPATPEANAPSAWRRRRLGTLRRCRSASRT